MYELVEYVKAYLNLYEMYIVPTFFIGTIVVAIFMLLLKKGYTKYAEKPIGTVLCGLILSISIAVVIVMTIYGRTQGEETVFRVLLFSSYIEAFGNGNVEVILQIIMNVVMFVPIGLFLPCCFKVYEDNKSVLLMALFASGCIELIQGFARIGRFELDDILGNVMGVEIGYWIWRGIRKIVRA